MRNPLFIAVLLLGLTSTAFAQSPTVNPLGLTFEHDEFAIAVSYSVGYFASDTATTPVQEAAFPKPASCPANAQDGVPTCSGPLPGRPVTFQTWYLRVRAIYSGGVSGPWSAEIVPFVRAPLAPKNVKVQ